MWSMSHPGNPLMKLYGYYRSSTSYRLRIALELKGLAFENVPVNLLKAEQKGEAYSGRNPFATVPMLEADGRDRAQSMALIEWLDEAYPQNPLLPADLEERYTARELAYARTDPTPEFTLISAFHGYVLFFGCLLTPM